MATYRRWTSWALLGLLGAGIFGCELIAKVDRDKIDDGATAGGGGAAGAAGKDGGLGGSGGVDGGGGSAGKEAGTGGTGGKEAGAGGSGGKEAGTGGNAGTGGTEGGVGGSQDAGDAAEAGTECTVPEDCPQTSNECVLRACTNGYCGTENVAAGTATNSQITGDCKQSQCDGNGAITQAPLDTDLPDDANPCTDDKCVSGTPTHDNTALNTTCATNLVCDGQGHCTGCTAADQCPGADDECKTRKCDNGICGFNYAASGTVLTTQTTGDCKVSQCDGVGGIVPVVDNNDKPVDSNDCTSDLCQNGAPSNPNAIAGTTCNQNNGKVCDGSGACVECVSALTCPGQDTDCQVRACNNHTCSMSNVATGTAVAASSQTPGDCRVKQCDGQGGVTTVVDDNDVPVDNKDCTGDVCTSGTPTNPPLSQGTSCGASLLCDANGNCVGCVTEADCAGANTACKTKKCDNGTCGWDYVAANTDLSQQTAGDCRKQQCDGLGNIVDVLDAADTPDDSNDCTSDVCDNGLPKNNPKQAGEACSSNGGAVCNGAGFCVQCLQASSCPGQDTECQTRTCSSGVCGFSYTTAGHVLASTAQIAGDCRLKECNGTGGVNDAIDNTDLPVDGNLCTKDVCTAGVKSNPPESLDTACGGTNKCDGSGNCVGCNVAADCAGSDTECRTRKCDSNHTCGFTYTPVNTPIASQTPKDCKSNVCDGNGGTTIIADPNDLPVDGLACTKDECNGQDPANPFESSGTACSQNNGTVCNATGQCVQCLTSGTCPGQDNDCQSRSCLVGVCGLTLAQEGKITSSQLAGDCKRNQCDANGNIVAVTFDSDLPVDGKQCTSDVCDNGAALNPPLSSGSTCSEGSGIKCDGAGACVACLEAADCGTSTACKTYTCSTEHACSSTNATAGTVVTNATAGDCHSDQCDGNGNILTNAVDANDKPADDGNQCTVEVCNGGTPEHQNAASGATCSQNNGSVCDGNGACVTCTLDTQCPTGGACQAAKCDSGACGFVAATAGDLPSALQTAGDCQKKYCDGTSQTVLNAVDDADVPADDGKACTTDTCSNGSPVHPAVSQGTGCNQNNGTKCDANGNCVACFDASECTAGSNPCQVATCTNGFCGFAAATATDLPAGQQTAGDCQKKVCDGTNQTVQSVPDDGDVPASDGKECTDDICDNGSPLHQNKAPGTGCSQGGGSKCDANGNCVACLQASDCGQATACKSFTCDSGACTPHLTQAGTVVANPVAGDCKSNQCDASGNIVTDANDDTDKPADDGTLCTTEGCNAGSPVHAPVIAGTSCNDNGGTQCDGTGHCVGCTSASQCGTDTACKTFTCDSGVCNTHNVNAGTVVANPSTGDCKSNQCDGDGNITVGANDDNDKPADDGTLCTIEGCNAGSPVHTPVAPSTACSDNSGTMCNSTGQCVQCLEVSDCGTSTACKIFTCTSGACGTTLPLLGTVVANPTVGDCQSNQCDGAGNIVTGAIDDNDLPVDGFQCTNDVCSGGVPSNPPVSAGTSCSQGGGVGCDGNGNCVAAPQVQSTTPADGATAVVASTPVAVTFSTAMDPATLTAQTTNGACSGSIQVSVNDFTTCVGFSAAAPAMSGGNTIATLTPQPGLLVNRTYKVRVTTAAKSAVNIALGAQYTSTTGFATTYPIAVFDNSVVISQVYLQGGADAAGWNYDYVELHNRGGQSVNVSTWSVQYAGASTLPFSTVVNLSGSIPAGGYFLVRFGTASSTTGTPLTTYDAFSGTNIGGNGKIALAKVQTAIATCSDSNVVDLVGFGSANCSETAVATAPTALQAAYRDTIGCNDANNNAADFVIAAPVPRYSASTAAPCPAAAMNETGVAGEADWCVVQSPKSLTATAGTGQTVYGRIYEAGVTTNAGQQSTIKAQLGYGPVTANPEYQPGWAWMTAAFNVEYGNDDEYTATFNAPAAGTYRYAYRFSFDSGLTWTYCDTNGSGSNTDQWFDFEDLAPMTTN